MYYECLKKVTNFAVQVFFLKDQLYTWFTSPPKY